MKEVNPQTTTRAYAFEMWMNAPMPMVTFFKTLDVSNLEDAQLVVMYSAWTWRRRDTGEGMPRMLRWALNNRILGQNANG